MRVPWRRPGGEEGGVSLLQRPLALNGAAAAAAAAEISVTFPLLLHKYTVYTLSLLRVYVQRAIIHGGWCGAWEDGRDGW